MNKTISLAAIAMFAVIMGMGAFAPAAMAADKVTMCHVDNDDGGDSVTISVSVNAVPAHLEHGDTLGACPT